MKKTILVIIIFLLMINSFVITTLATEGEPIQDVPEQNNGTEELNNDMQLIEKSDIITDTYGRIIEARSPREIQSGTVKDRVQDVKVEIIEGEYIGEEFETTFTLSYDIEGKIQAYELDVGDKVLVQLSEDLEGHVTATVQDVVRSGYIIGMFILFLLSIVLVGGKKGVKAILGLLYTIILIYLIMIKGIFKGDNAIILSVGTSMLVILGTFIIIGGFNKKITTAAIGTLGGVISAGLMALIFNHLAKMSGACEDAIQLSVSMSTINFDFRDLLFAGIIVSALGACMDVGMSIASSLDEIKMKNSDITWKELFKSGMNIGRDVIGTMTNTLILAYVGGSLTLILLFMACNMSIIDILNKETIAEQIISAIAGSMGVIYTVPITSFIYSVLNKDKVIYKKNSENRIDGKRSLKI